MKRRLISATALALLSVYVVGCGPQHGKTPGTYPARGKVTLSSGKAVNNMYIRFIPTSLEGVEAEAELADDGSFTLTSIGDKEGAVPGKYKVFIDTKTPLPRLAGKKSPMAGQVPTSYTKSATTPLSVEVKAEDNHFNFVLK